MSNIGPEFVLDLPPLCAANDPHQSDDVDALIDTLIDAKGAPPAVAIETDRYERDEVVFRALVPGETVFGTYPSRVTVSLDAATLERRFAGLVVDVIGWHSAGGKSTTYAIPHALVDGDGLRAFDEARAQRRSISQAILAAIDATAGFARIVAPTFTPGDAHAELSPTQSHARLVASYHLHRDNEEKAVAAFERNDTRFAQAASKLGIARAGLLHLAGATRAFAGAGFTTEVRDYLAPFRPHAPVKGPHTYAAARPRETVGSNTVGGGLVSFVKESPIAAVGIVAVVGGLAYALAR